MTALAEKGARGRVSHAPGDVVRVDFGVPDGSWALPSRALRRRRPPRERPPRQRR
eukprot:gene11086-3816_t